MVINMNLSFKLIALLLSIVLENVLGQRYEGDLCTLPSSGANGICKLISSCPSALEALKTKGTFPKNCGFKNNQPIVCCAEGSSPVITSGTPPPPVTISTRGVTLTPTRRIVPNTRPTVIQRPGSVGDKTKRKCREYADLVYQDAGVITIIGATLPPIDDCVVIQVENIVGGTPAKPKEFPHMALVGFEDDENVVHWDCGGSLISEKFVLSAAHCTYHKSLRREAKYILLGELVLDSTTDDSRPQRILIKSYTRHPEYIPPSNYHDIALFELQREADLGTYVRPACLNTNPSLTNRLGVASGFGRTSTFGDVSKSMQKVTLDMFTTAECNNTYRRNVGLSLAHGIVEDTQICAGSRNESKDTCQGDSGGPLQIINSERELFCTYSVIGITSFGKDCGRVNFPGVYTRVSAYIKWIEDIVWP